MLNNYVSDIIEKSCQELNMPYMHTISGAGHDAMNMAEITECGMIFVKNDSGVSHHQNEEIVLSTSNDTTFIRHDIAISTKKA